MKNKHRVFVYGTLRRNEGNHRLLAEATLLAEQAWTTGLLFDTGFGYPALQKHHQGQVYGELYEINDNQLARLDSLEGYHGEANNSFYGRATQPIYTDQGIHEAFVYVMNDKEMLNNQIQSGNWKVNRLIKQTALLYFAYGSCMDDARFKEAGVNEFFQKVIGLGILDGYSLCFTRRSSDGGRADIVEAGGVVEGKVYQITVEALPYLYRREAVNAGCYRSTVVQVKMDDNTLRDVLTFTVVDKEPELAPPTHYMEEIIRGGKGFLSDEYMKNLEDRFPTILV